MVKSVHPEIEGILKILNRYCTHKKVVIDLRHLREHGIVISFIEKFGGSKENKYVNIL